MIVHRFMSDLEYQRLMAGETLTNTTVHAAEGRKSRSVGFCFFTESPEEAIHWLSFNVSTDWCVTFDIPDKTAMIPSRDAANLIAQEAQDISG